MLLTDLRGSIGFASFAVLTYYAVANAAAFTLPGPQRRWLRPFAALGGAGCVLLALALPPRTVLAGAAVLAARLIWRALTPRERGSRRSRVDP